MPQPNITSRDIVKRYVSEFAQSRFVYKIVGMGQGNKYPFEDQGRRLRWLRQAERYPTAVAFAARMRWPQSAISQFETGMRRVPTDKVIQLRTEIVGFDPLWLWEGDKRGLSFDLRTRIEAEEAKEPPPEPEEDPAESGDSLTGDER